MHRFSIRFVLACLATIVAAACGGSSAVGAECPHCHQDCCDDVSYQCRMELEKIPIKKFIYRYKDVPICVPCGPRLGACDSCATCDSPRFKRMLIKQEVVVGEKCITKCVVEAVRKPCSHCGKGPGMPSK